MRQEIGGDVCLADTGCGAANSTAERKEGVKVLQQPHSGQPSVELPSGSSFGQACSKCLLITSVAVLDAIVDVVGMALHGIDTQTPIKTMTTPTMRLHVA